MKKDIETLDDVKLMVNTFYDSIQKDNILGPIFEEKVGGKWDEHLAKMYRFWQSILLGENTYNGAPFPPHARLPIDESHFILWVKIFTTTVDDLFTGDVANEAKRRGTLMAALFNSKIEFFKSHGL
jgi:hemoglobin